MLLSLGTLSSYNPHFQGPGMSLLSGTLLHLLSFFKTHCLLGTCTSRLAVHMFPAAVLVTATWSWRPWSPAQGPPLPHPPPPTPAPGMLKPCLQVTFRSPYASHRKPPMSFGFSLTALQLSPLWPVSPGGQAHVSSLGTPGTQRG